MSSQPAPGSPAALLTSPMGDLLRARRTLERTVDSFARVLGLRLGEIDLILELFASPEGIGQRELVRRLRLSHASVSTTVTKLANRGLVERIETAGDGRSWRVRLASRDLDRALAIGLTTRSEELSRALGRSGLATLSVLARATDL